MKEIITYEEYENAMKIVKAYKFQCEQAIEEIDRETNDKSNVFFSDVHTSVRLYNAICSNAEILNLPEWHKIKMYHFKDVKLSKIKTIRKFGEKTIEELQLLCKEYGVTLK